MSTSPRIGSGFRSINPRPSKKNDDLTISTLNSMFGPTKSSMKPQGLVNLHKTAKEEEEEMKSLFAIKINR